MAETSEERIQILKLLEEDKITAEEAIGLLNAVGRAGKPASPPPAPESPKKMTAIEPVTNPAKVDSPSAGKFRFFRVRVTDTRTGTPKVMVTIPIGLMEWGLKIGAQFSPEINSINIADFNTLMESGIDGKLVDVVDEEDGEHVEVFVE